MENGFFLITGTSRGLGEALTRKILQEGNTVLGVSRNRPDILRNANYFHLAFDLTDSSMQLAVRSKTRDEFALADFFKQAFEDGRLQEPGKAAEKIYTILRKKYEQGKYVSVSEI